jgi:serine/threonine-protein kinase
VTDDSPSPSGVRPGDVLAGKYRVEHVLGAGGMGVVVAAHHLQLDQRVALKFLLPQALASAEVVGRFDREARAAVRIKSEHVARVIDVGKLETGAPYMVMEYLEGGDLAAWLERRGPLAVPQAVEFILQACEAIAEAHALGIIHRDLKPANLFCTRRPDGALSIKVLDFGISKMTGLLSSGDMGMTRTATLIGSPFYMSPEQMHSARGVDVRTDIWSLGVILFELLTDRLPFEAEALPELVIKVMRDPVPPVAGHRADVPPALDAVIARCLEKDRERRYPDVAQLALALVEFGSPRARHSLEVVSGIGRRSHGGDAFSIEMPATAAGLPLAALRPPTVASWGGTGAPPVPSPPPERRTGLFVGLGGGLGVCALVALALRLLPRPVELPGDAQAPRPATEGAPLVWSPEAGADTVRLADASDALTDSGPERRDAPRLEPAAADAGRSFRLPPTPQPQPPPQTTPPRPHPSPNCTPPYFYDGAGNKVFKPECLS